MKLHEKIVRGGIWVGLVLTFFIPVYVETDFFFPYIFSKALAFRIITSILFVLFIYLVAVLKKSKIKLDFVTILLGVYLGVMCVSSLLGISFNFSFWSSIERSEGLLFWAHLFLLFIVLKNFITKKREWHWTMDAFFAGAQVVAVIALLQFLQVDFINVSAGGSRLASTIGNAAFLAGYMLFAVFIGLYLAFSRNKKLQIYYYAAVILDVFILAQTETRGAFIALLGAFAFFVIFNTIKLSHKKLKLSLGIVGLVLVISSIFIYINKNSDFILENNVLRRLTSISLSEKTAQTRIMTWQSAWKGFKEKPILGYGQENFSIVFNKFFNPEIFEDEGSRIWFDRAHNMFIDHLVIGGIIGLILYVLILFYPLVLFIKKGKPSFSDDSPVIKEQLAYQMIVLSLVTFMIQGIFVFETIPTYLGLFLVVAFIMQQHSKTIKRVPYKVSFLLFVLTVLAIVPVMYRVNILEAKASKLTVQGLRMQPVNQLRAVDLYEQAIDLDTSGKQETRERLAEHVASMLVSKSADPTVLLKLSERVDSELEKRMEEHPGDVANYMLYMRHINHTHVLDAERLYRVFEIGKKALGYSPTRPNIYYELGYAHFYLSEFQKKNENEKKRAEHIDSMISEFRKAIELNDDVLESYVNMIMVLLATEQGDLIQPYFDAMDEKGVDYKEKLEPLTRMSDSAVNAKQFDWSAQLYQWLIDLVPNNPQYYISLSLSYANIGENDKAIETAGKVAEFGGKFVAESEAFIDRIKSGTFELDQ